MPPPPPRIVRRVILAPAVLLICLVVVALSPLLLVGAAIADLVAGRRWQRARIVAFGVVYLAYEAVAIVALFVLWLVSGFGLALRRPRMQDAHYAFMRWWLRGLGRAAGALCGLRITVEHQPEHTAGPVLVFGRHAGAGNSLMLVGTLLGYRRRPRIVMLATLQWDPGFDILGNRLPNRFIDHDPTRADGYVDAIGRLASGLEGLDALVIFPEGHDFTPNLRSRAIAHLRKRGLAEEAAKAEELENVLPPRHRGALAAIRAAPDADVTFVAHTVLEELGSFRGLWRRLPLAAPIEACYWRVPAADVPRSDDLVVDWLFDWWERIDTWIDEHVPREERPASPA